MADTKGFSLQMKKVSVFLALVFLFFPRLHAERETEEITLTPGCRLFKVIDKNIPLVFYMLEADLRESGITVLPVIAQDLFPGRETIRFMSFRYDRPEFKLIAGVNADFWQIAAPIGLTVINGEIARSPNARSSFVLSKRNEPNIDVFRIDIGLQEGTIPPIKIDSINKFRNELNVVLFTRVNGRTTRTRGKGIEYILDPHGHSIPTSGTVSVSVEARCSEPSNNRIDENKWVLSIGGKRALQIPVLVPGTVLNMTVNVDPRSADVFHAVSGGPRILRNGAVSVEIEEEAIRKGFDTERHPRTAIGFSEDKRYLYVCVVDGRRIGYSRGASLYELAELMREFGCSEAMNFDGGGSSSMVVDGGIVNRPSDPTGIRPVSSGIFIVKRIKER
ncbi:phosphodiester glycosidase family protein [Acidobacteriota bacterium]